MAIVSYLIPVLLVINLQEMSKLAEDLHDILVKAWLVM